MRRFGNVPNLEKKYTRRPGVYAILTRGDQILLTYQEEPDFEFQLPGGGIDQALEDINIVNNGKIFFFLDTAGRLGKFNLSRPFDFRSATFENRFITPDNTPDSASFSRDGKKMFLLSSQNNTPN